MSEYQPLRFHFHASGYALSAHFHRPVGENVRLMHSRWHGNGNEGAGIRTWTYLRGFYQREYLILLMLEINHEIHARNFITFIPLALYAGASDNQNAVLSSTIQPRWHKQLYFAAGFFSWEARFYYCAARFCLQL